MEILANNVEIGNYLYPLMTNEEVINKPYYRRIIHEMIEHKDNKHYAYLLCYYAVGPNKTKQAQYINECFFDYDILYKYDINELLRLVDDKLNVIDTEFKDVNQKEITTSKKEEKTKSLIKRIFKKN